MEVKVTLKGQWTWEGGRIAGMMKGLIADATEAAAIAAAHEAEYEFALTQAEVPVNTGELMMSGHVKPLRKDGRTVAFGIIYGGPPGSGGANVEDVTYAWIVHEDLEANHPNGKAKYVEDPVRAEMESGRARDRMAADMRAILGAPNIKTALVAFKTRRGGAVRGPGGRFMGSTKG